MRYKAVKPILEGYCTGCVFNDDKMLCIRTSADLYPCVIKNIYSQFIHEYIYIRERELNSNIIIL